MPYAIRGFFENGGLRCYVSRIVPSQSRAARANIGNLRLIAVGQGTWGNDVRFRMTRNSNTTCCLEIEFARIHERFENIRFDAIATHSINAESRIVRAWWENVGSTTVADETVSGRFAGGTDGVGDLAASDFDGYTEPMEDAHEAMPSDLLGRGRGLKALEAVEEIAILLAPDEVSFPDVSQRRIDSMCGAKRPLRCHLWKKRRTRYHSSTTRLYLRSLLLSVDLR